MKNLFASLLFAGAALTGAFAQAHEVKPTVVLVHGAFADASSWNGVVKLLRQDGYPVLAVANPLRSVQTDAAYVSSTLNSITGPIVLVGHSYGGSVISEAAVGHANVTSLVYVAAFAPDKDETALGLSTLFPGSTLSAALAPPVPLANGDVDLYVQQDKFPDQFAADVPQADAAIAAAEQRPITFSALNEKETTPAWRTIPSYFVYGSKDKTIPPQVHAFMAFRAWSRETIDIPGASHLVMVSHPRTVAQLIETAAKTH